MRIEQKIASNMASGTDSFTEIPTKRARIEEDIGGQGPCPSDIFDVHLSNGHGEEAPVDCITPSIPAENCDFIHFPENLGGQGLTSLAESVGSAQNVSISKTEVGASTSTIQVPDPAQAGLQLPIDGIGNPVGSDQSANEDQEGNGEDNSNDSWSTISDISGLSEDAWKPVSGPMSWVHRQVSMGTDPRSILTDMLPDGMELPSDLDNYSLWRLVINLLMEPPRRKKLENINTFEDVVHLLKTCKKIMVLTGAGVSVSCGIPDFRSRDGVYARLAVDFPNLPDPQAMFDIHFFKGDQRPFFKFAKEIYPGQFEPSKCHKFIKLLDDHNKLLRNYTQNIDTLEQVAGIKNVIQCHGSFATAQCMACKHKVDADVIKKDIFDQVIPACPVCPPGTPYAIMKPNIVFFGESLPEEFHRQMADDKDECDLLIVIGSSLKVRPVALIPNSLPAHVPQILINRERLRHMDFDVELLGDCDVIVNELCKHLGEGWDKLSNNQPVLKHKEKSELCEDSKNMCSNIVSAYSCELRGDNCLSTDSNSSDSQSAVNHKQDTGDSQPTTPDVTPSTNTLDNRNSELCSNQSALRNSNSSETTDNDNIESTDETSNQMRSFFQPRPRQSLAKRLKNDELLFLPPNRYVFSGAEVYSDDDFDDSDSESEDGDEDTKTTNDDVQTENLDNQHQNDKVVPDVKAKENYEVSIRDIIDIAK